jgi:hypothetical protein
MRMKMKSGFILAGVMAMTSAGVSTATQAQSIDPFPGGSPGVMVESPTIFAGVFEYTVDMGISGGNSVIAGDQFAIFDVLDPSLTPPNGFANFPPGGNWAVTPETHTSYSIDGTTSQDNSTRGDVVFSYIGATPVATTLGGAAVDLGSFSFLSTVDLGAGTSVFGGAIYNSTPDGSGSVGANEVNGIKWIVVGGGAPNLPTPLPSAFGPGVLLLAGLAFFGKRRMSKAAI